MDSEVKTPAYHFHGHTRVFYQVYLEPQPRASHDDWTSEGGISGINTFALKIHSLFRQSKHPISIASSSNRLRRPYAFCVGRPAADPHQNAHSVIRKTTLHTRRNTASPPNCRIRALGTLRVPAAPKAPRRPDRTAPRFAPVCRRRRLLFEPPEARPRGRCLRRTGHPGLTRRI